MATKKQDKTELVTIVEGLTASGQRSIDVGASVIRGVKLIGCESINGRFYPPAVLRAALAHYEGAKVNVDHPTGGDPTKPRALQDRIGTIRGARIVEGSNGGVFGDFHYNPKHRLASQIEWDAQNNPESLGFSHNALLRLGATRDGRTTVEEIVRVRSVDLVADPATTRSLFESDNTMPDAMLPQAAPAATPEKTDPKDAVKSAFRAMVIAAFDDESLDIKATLAKIRQIMTAQEKLLGGDLVKDDAGGAAGTEEVNLRQQVALLTQQVEQFKAKEKQTQTVLVIEAELAAAGLDKSNPVHVSETFSKILLACESADGRKALIEDRKALVTAAGARLRPAESRDAGKPKSAPSYATEQIDPKTFAQRLRQPMAVR